MENSLVSSLFPIGLAALHVVVGKLHWLDRILPKERWISLGAGVSIAYIFLDILPELGKAQVEIEHLKWSFIEFLEKHSYILALVGLVLFYGLELLAARSREANKSAGKSDSTSVGIFWVHIGAFALYNALIGELLSHTETRGFLPTLLLGITLALHFLINDRSLREHHKAPYDRIGRWVLAGALILGWVIGQSFQLLPGAIALLWALVAGGMILNVLKEELPDTQESCFFTFSMSAGIYAVLLLAVSL
ncbi:hypothetical protein IQ249_06065 [Lusitaniella coriacea LEGE 07157]|uniref:ZIP Zinc transporter n=1 Tax=Lusitaniella coriacea LEGE 07157 TaxID=945747 RepID=A0A8J7DT69_9CYAN|nr:hypothetical protein [Lusitaniella coriacea]MBE9115462.1 hypothetical protein [Lusitaniella coriacea LEGE 07157]